MEYQIQNMFSLDGDEDVGVGEYHLNDCYKDKGVDDLENLNYF